MNEKQDIKMKMERFEIGSIPAILYGPPSKQGYLFLHGQMGYKEEARVFAEVVCSKGFQVLAIDLPDHGERRGHGEELAPWTAVPDIQAALKYAKSLWRTISLRTNSIGTYFAMLAVEAPDSALLVSPILDMDKLILTMMDWAGVTEDQLRRQGQITTSFGQTLSWKYLCWVREHPTHTWNCPIHILYASEDNMTSRSVVEEYARQHNALLTVMEGGEHWFHTPEQLAFLREWEDVSCGITLH